MFMPFPEITLPMTPNSPPRPGFRLHLPWLLLTVAGMSVFVALGRWQWQRAAEKRVIEAAFVAAASARATPLGAGSLGSLPRYSPIEATGQYDAAHSFLLDNVTEGGQAGYQIVTPLELTDGRWILVNRGWVPLVKRARSELPEVQQNLPAGVVTIRGLVDELPVPDWPLAAYRPPPAPIGRGSPASPKPPILGQRWAIPSSRDRSCWPRPNPADICAIGSRPVHHSHLIATSPTLCSGGAWPALSWASTCS